MMQDFRVLGDRYILGLMYILLYVLYMTDMMFIYETSDVSDIL